jgi:hypothetical protein
MTFGELIENITIQGKVRLSKWVDEEEVVVKYYETENLDGEKIPRGWRELEVSYLFTPVDGYLHIELK